MRDATARARSRSRVRLRALLLGSCLRSWPERQLALALPLLVAPGSECWPDARLALGFALARGSRLGILD